MAFRGVELSSLLLQAANIVKRYGPLEVLSGIDLTLQSGQMCRVSGANGAGKSTLLRILAGLNVPDAGTVTTDPVAYAGHAPGLDADLTAEDALAVYGMLDPAHDRVRLRQVQQDLLLESHLHKRVAVLSAGTRQKLNLALLLASRAPVWIVDEPFNALDADSVAYVAGCFASHTASGSCLLWTSHGPVPAAMQSGNHSELAL